MTLLSRLKKRLSGSKKPTLKKAAPTTPKKSVAKKPAPKKSVAKKIVKRIPKKIVKKATQKKQVKHVPKKGMKKQLKKKTLAKKRPVRQSKKARKEAAFAQAIILHQQEPEKKPIKPYPIMPGGQNERVSTIITVVRDLVKKGTISDWLIDLQHNRSANIFVERNFVVEDETTTIRDDVLLTIYERFPDGTIGEAQIPVIATEQQTIREQILAAKDTCTYARKKAFTLPEPEEGITFPQSYDEKMLTASFEGNGLVVARGIYTTIKEIMTPMLDVKVNSFEVLTSASTIRVINSNGVDVSYHKTAIYLEVVLTCKNKTEEREFLMMRIAVSPEQFDLKNILLQQARIVRDALNATPNPGFTGDVMLAGQSVTEFFTPHFDLNPLVLHTSAKIHSMSLSNLKVGQPLGHILGEPITISSNPHLPLGLFTAPVDDEGTPLRVVELIRNGTFVNHFATARYAQYLSVPATGNISNVQVNPGATREEHLRGNNYIEIIGFSWFNPNSFSGDFSAEIRLCYHWQNGKKTAYRGGTFTGNVFKNILRARFSKESTQSAQYYGPRAVLFKQAEITKFEN